MKTPTLDEVLKLIQKKEINLGIVSTPCIGFNIIQHNNKVFDLKQLPGYRQKIIAEGVPLNKLAKTLLHHYNTIVTNKKYY